MSEKEFKTPLDKYKKDISQDLIEFVNSSEFSRFELIIENLYLSRLEQLQSESEEHDIVVSQKVLNIYSNLPQLLKIMSHEVIEQRRNEAERD